MLKAQYFVILMISCILIYGSSEALATPSCISYFFKHKLVVREFPAPGSKAFQELSKNLAADLQNTDKNFNLVSLENVLNTVYTNTLVKEIISYVKENSHIIEGYGQSRPLNFTPETGDPGNIKALKAVAKNITLLIQSAVQQAYGVTIYAAPVQIRYLSKESDATAPEWHVDGPILSAILNLQGPGVEYSPSSNFSFAPLREIKGLPERLHDDYPDIQSLKPLQLLIFSGENKIESFSQKILDSNRPLVHRSPRIKAERLLIMFRFTFYKPSQPQ